VIKWPCLVAFLQSLLVVFKSLIFNISSKHKAFHKYVLLYTVANAQKGPGIVIVHPGQDVELLCNITGGTSWE